MDTQSYIAIASGLLSFAASAGFAVQIHKMKLQVNLATWGMVLILDIVGLMLAVLSGNSEPYLQVGWLVAAIIIFIAAWINRGNWKWGRIETYATVCCGISVLVWVCAGFLKYNPAWSLIGYLVACFVATWPQAEQYWYNHIEARKTTWLWALSVAIIVLSIAGLKEYSPQYVLVPLGLLALNLGMTWLTLRQPIP